ncbi:hypothetical protein [Nocardia higoensis]|uniref:hypothetical protein n=1 Tax=Nocardia higoensis TaxID=228599 RepID=UPI0002FE4767|nr:hypothetical protein [Nocardia higoensis]
MTIQVRVYLNTDPTALLSGHPPRAPLALAYTYRIRTDTDTDDALLERVFATFNDHPSHHDDHEHASAWYALGHRSLSVGDVVGLDDRHYACQSTGWTPVPAPPT